MVAELIRAGVEGLNRNNFAAAVGAAGALAAVASRSTDAVTAGIGRRLGDIADEMSGRVGRSFSPAGPPPPPPPPRPPPGPPPPRPPPGLSRPSLTNYPPPTPPTKRTTFTPVTLPAKSRQNINRAVSSVTGSTANLLAARTASAFAPAQLAQIRREQQAAVLAAEQRRTQAAVNQQRILQGPAAERDRLRQRNLDKTAGAREGDLAAAGITPPTFRSSNVLSELAGVGEAKLAASTAFRTTPAIGRLQPPTRNIPKQAALTAQLMRRNVPPTSVGVGLPNAERERLTAAAERTRNAALQKYYKAQAKAPTVDPLVEINAASLAAKVAAEEAAAGAVDEQLGGIRSTRRRKNKNNKGRRKTRSV